MCVWVFPSVIMLAMHFFTKSLTCMVTVEWLITACLSSQDHFFSLCQIQISSWLFSQHASQLSAISLSCFQWVGRIWIIQHPYSVTWRGRSACACLFVHVCVFVWKRERGTRTGQLFMPVRTHYNYHYYFYFLCFYLARWALSSQMSEWWSYIIGWPEFPHCPLRLQN